MPNLLKEVISNNGPTDLLSIDATDTIKRDLEHQMPFIHYAKETFHYDGYSEHGGEIAIDTLYVIIYMLHVPYNGDLAPQYEYRTYRREYLIDVDSIPDYELVDTQIHYVVDAELFI